MSKTDLFPTIQFSSIWPIGRNLSSGPGCDGNEGVPRINKGSSITGTSPSDRLMSYLGH